MRLPGDSRRNKLLLRAVALVAVVAAYYFVARNLEHIDLANLLDEVSDTLGAWTYLMVGTFAFLETGAFVGLVVPGETVMLLGGAVAGQGAIDLYLLIAIAWFSAWAGDTTSFFIGRRLGRSFVLRHGPRFGVSHERFERVEDYFAKHGGKTIFLGRFVSLVRAFAPFIAGSSGMRYRAFVPYSILGTGLWASAHILIGYIFSRSIEEAAGYAGRGALVLGTLIVVVAVIVVAVRFLREPENRRQAVEWLEARKATSWTVALGRRLRPQAAFLWDRVTPGGTFGLELTTLTAALAVAVFVLVSYSVIVSGDPGPTPGDTTAIHVASSLRVGWLTTVAKALTHLGSGPVVVPLAIVCATALALGGRWTELAVLAAGLAIVIFGVAELKEIVDRPRPTGGLVGFSGASFPSGHAAYSTVYVWLAATVVLRLRPGMTRGTAVVLAGIVLAALVGLSRVYLGVHYLSDVSGGWALGVAAFSLCAAIALIVSQLRQNAGDAAGADCQ